MIFLQKKAVSPSVNSACENYRPDVEQIAAEYDMSDYTDLILALMMQESSGHGADVIQSSEGAYNTEYPQEPNGITDVDYSIRCGIQELKYAMQKAGDTSPSDISHIKLALQAYNFGADSYFNYLRNHGITEWSVSSSEAFCTDGKRVILPVPRKILIIILPVHGTTEINIILNMYSAITPKIVLCPSHFFSIIQSFKIF